MSRSITKLKAKALRKENAIKKASRKKILTISICALAVIAAAAIGMRQNDSGQSEAEIYRNGRSSIQLLSDGTFTASLPHNVRKRGTYTKTTEDTRTVVSFNVNGRIETGRIENNALHIPGEWDDGHGHGNVFQREN